MSKDEQDDKFICTNRQAYHNFFILEKYEAGIELKGTEVKSLRASKANLKDSFAHISGEKLVLHNLYIGPYEHGNRYNHEPLRNRNLLMHKYEINKLIGKIKEKGLALIPLKLYFNAKGIAKVELAVCKGKKLFDKRDTLKKKEASREMERAFKEKQTY